jgi:hypothetical protein
MLPLTLPPSRWTLAGAAAITAVLIAGDVIG